MCIYKKTMFHATAAIIFSFTSSIFGANILFGDGVAENQTFNFTIDLHVPNRADTTLYLAAAADQAGSTKQFAVSRINTGSNLIEPLTPEKVIFNAQSDAFNPLFDQGIRAFSLVEDPTGSLSLAGSNERPVIVTESDPQTLYVINGITSREISVISAAQFTEVDKEVQQLSTKNNVPDANAMVTSGVCALAASNARVFAAVKPNGSNTFGDPGSGVAMAVLGDIESRGAFALVDAPSGVLQQPGGIRALALDRTSDEIKIGNDVTSIGNIIDMYWDPNLRRTYIALQVVGGIGANDGARSIVVARVQPVEVPKPTEEDPNAVIETYQLKFSPIAPNTVFDGAQNKIVGGTGASIEVSANKVRTMLTSTGLSYLIVQGNIGAPDAVQKCVFALPLVRGNDDPALNGTIADKNAIPEDCFSHEVCWFRLRELVTPAIEPDQMTLSTDVFAQVGGGQLPAGDITDMFIRGDVVFVTVQNPDANQQPGMFYSQALFDNESRIKAWTTWRRATATFTSGNLDELQAGGIDACAGDFISIIGQSDATTIKRTTWGEQQVPDDNLERNVTVKFEQECGGIQGLFDIPENNTALQNISLLIATGLDTVVLAQTGRQDGDAFVPYDNTVYKKCISFNNGTITQTFPVDMTKIISISGGALCDIGPIVAAEIARDGTGDNGWLFVGGANGVAVLSNPDGSGWDANTQLGDCFDGLVDGMSFKQIGEYCNVRKIIHDGNFLYILTDCKVDRIDLTQGNIGIGQFEPVTVADVDSIVGIDCRGTLMDFTVSEKLAFIGASSGLFRVGDGRDIRTATHPGLVNWTMLPQPEGVGPMRQLIPFSVTGYAQDMALLEGGQLYTLNAYRGKNQARVYRYVVQSVAGQEITQNTVQLFDDVYVLCVQPTFFINFGQFRNLFNTDGALYYHTRSQDLSECANLKLTPPEPVPGVGMRFVGVKSRDITLAREGTLFAGLTRNSASGSWMVGGDFGLQINE